MMGKAEDKKIDATKDPRRERSPRREAMGAFPSAKAKAAAKPFRKDGEEDSVG